MKPDIECHYLKENKAQAFPSKVLYLDTETEAKEYEHHVDHHFKLAWTCYAEYGTGSHRVLPQWVFWKNPEQLNEYILSKCYEKSSLYIFAHNVYFDLQVIEFFHYFRLYGFRYDFYYDKGLVYILCIHKGTRTIKAISSTNYFACNLGKLGEMLGIPKTTVDFSSVSEKDLAEYCRNDTEILKRGVEYYMSFVRDHDLGNMGLTKSSQAMNAYRHRFMIHKLGRHSDQRIVGLERSAYHGGRVECHELGELRNGPFLYLDINSMYPFVMKNYPLPTRCIDYLENPLPGTVEALFHGHSAIAEVEVCTDVPCYAVLLNEKLCFPVGRFKTFLCTGGLKYAISHDHIRSVSRIAVYEQGYIFGHYIDYFYDLRQAYKKDQNDIMEHLCKVMLNSLYGKFGERRTIETVTETRNDVPFHRLEVFDNITGEHWIEISLFGSKIKKSGLREGKNSIVSIPAHITEYARFMIWSIMENLGYENVLYCDTDSVLIRAADFSRLEYPVHETELGSLKIEKEVERAVLYGPKDYIMDDVVKVKGVPKTAIEDSQGHFLYNEFPGQSTHMELGIERFFRVLKKAKTLVREYDKGVVIPGGIVEPFALELPDRSSLLPG